jgi:hypothetical protein
MRGWVSVLLTGLLVSLVVVPTLGAKRCEWIYQGDDNLEATELLAEFLEDHEVDVYSVRDYFVVVQDRFKVLLEPKMSTDGLDRVVAHVIFSVKDFYKGSRTLLNFVNGLNQKYNIGAFYINEDGDFAFQTQLTFLDHVCWDELGAFVEWVNKSLYAIIKVNEDDFTKYLK